MKHINEVKVYYEETDSYGVVWHGSYIKWLEVGRVELSNLLGIDFQELDAKNILTPVVDLNIRYKSPAKALDIILIKTSISELKKTSITFEHTITNKATEQLLVSATSTVVMTQNGKLCRKIPEFIYNKYKSATIKEAVI